MITIILIAISLSFDSFATAVGLSCKEKNHNIKTAFNIAFTFAFFQTLMPLLGYLIGNGLYRFITQIDHWIAFILLLGVGIRFIQEAYEDTKKIHAKSWNVLILLGIATSIDALVVGITFAFIDIPLITSLIVISVTTFIISFLGYEFGRRMCRIKPQKIEIIGGIILIALGIKILVEHLFI